MLLPRFFTTTRLIKLATGNEDLAKNPEFTTWLKTELMRRGYTQRKINERGNNQRVWSRAWMGEKNKDQERSINLERRKAIEEAKAKILAALEADVINWEFYGPLEMGEDGYIK